MSNLTASQTVGPFFRFALEHPSWSDLTADGTAGEPVRIVGRVLDGDGVGVPDAMLEIWQADSHGSYDRARDFRGFGRAATDPEGRYEFQTVRPGIVPTPDGTLQAPHIALTIFARGLLHHLVTRIYFGDRHVENASDPVLASIQDATVRETLFAVPEPSGNDGVARYHFDISLQGERETAFFDF
jgi:protocatechuate 3,4-dioxygenase alpha subunit